MKLAALTLFVMFCLASCAKKEAPSAAWKPKNGFVPDEKTAIAVAVAVWSPIYGEKTIAEEKPYRAELIDGVWYVSGYLQPNMLGGVAEAAISKADGRIIAITHGQ